MLHLGFLLHLNEKAYCTAPALQKCPERDRNTGERGKGQTWSVALESTPLMAILSQWFSGLATHESHLGAQTTWSGASPRVWPWPWHFPKLPRWFWCAARWYLVPTWGWDSSWVKRESFVTRWGDASSHCVTYAKIIGIIKSNISRSLGNFKKMFVTKPFLSAPRPSKSNWEACLYYRWVVGKKRTSIHPQNQQV